MLWELRFPTHPHLHLSKILAACLPREPRIIRDPFFVARGKSDFFQIYSLASESRFPALSDSGGRPDPDLLTPGPRFRGNQWRRPGSNRQPLACKASALPVELRPRSPLRGKLETRMSKLETVAGLRPSVSYFEFRASNFL